MPADEAGWAQGYLVSARTGARLRSLLREIDQLFVVMVNVQLVVGRAGEEASGFQALSERLNTLAREVGECLREANKAASVFCREVFQTYRANRVHGLLVELVEEAAVGEAGAQTAGERLGEASRRASAARERLYRYLDAILQHMETADHLGLNAHVEAAKTSAYQQQFRAVAEDVRRRAHYIRSVVDTVRPELNGWDFDGLAPSPTGAASHAVQDHL
jgi:hypothetical protein